MSKKTNLLPYDGKVFYYKEFLKHNDSKSYFQYFLDNIHWQHDEFFMFGKLITTSRKVSWYGDEGCEYIYAGKKKIPNIWDENLLKIKEQIEKITGEEYNSCLLNLYHNGNEGMGWHSDNEKELGEDISIASVSLGAERRFDFKHNITGIKKSIFLENCSLLLMLGDTQKFWKHQIPKTKKIIEPRINLTFRKIITKK